MINKRYRANIDIHDPNGYFENWYADMWFRCLPLKTGVYITEFREAFVRELEKEGATVDWFDYSKSYFNIWFSNDADYTLFVLKWS